MRSDYERFSQKMFAANLTQKDKELIAEELSILEGVKRELANQVRYFVEGKLGEASAVKIGVVETKDEMGAFYEQLNTFNALAQQRGKKPLPDPRCPYFARVVLEEESKTRDVLIGYGSLVGSSEAVPIVDWRTAPVAELFFQVSEGETFLQELPKRVAEGVVSKRRIINIKNSQLTGIITDHSSFKKSNGIWEKSEIKAIGAMQGGQGKAVRSIDIKRHEQPELLSLLDKEQFQALNEPAHQSLLVLGGAGSGKTTVALYRLAKLVSMGMKNETVLVIVPNPGLVNLCKNILTSMRLKSIAVYTFDDWVAHIGWKTFRGLPKKLCRVTPDEIVRIKRHNQIFHVLEEFLRDRKIAYENNLIKQFPQQRKVIEGTTWDTTKPLLSWFEKCQVRLTDVLPVSSKKVLNKLFYRLKKELLNFNDARVALFSDEKYVNKMVELDDSFNEYTAEKFIRHSREQFFERFKRFDIDKDTGRHLSLDGVDETDHDESQIYRTVDVEDFPILYYLLTRISGKSTLPGRETPSRYEHIVLDEAQELSLLEVKNLGVFLSKEGSVTIAGDAVQHTSTDSSFQSWEEVLTWMGLSRAARHRLSTNYRSTKPIAHLATYCLGSLSKFVPKVNKQGGPVLFDFFAGYGQAMVALADAIKKIVKLESEASIAIICREEKTANNIYKAIEFLNESRLILKGEFEFTPGVDVTTVEQVKGLEFDYVVIPDADSHVYKEDPFSRRLFHVAVTRAVHQLWVFSTAKPSLIIREYDPKKELVCLGS